MPIENPILSNIGGPVGQAEPLRIDTQAMDRGFNALGTAVRDVAIERTTREFKAELDKEESAYMDELYNLIQERDTREVLESENAAAEAVSTNEQVRSMFAAIKSEDTAAAQGIIDNNRLGVRKELIFREYAAKYPRLIPEFLKVASSSGLGGTSSLQTQEMVDYLNEGAVARQRAIEASASKSQAYLKELEKNSRKLGLEPPPPGSSDDVMVKWLERYTSLAAQHENYTVDLKGHSLYMNGKARNAAEVAQRVNQLVVTHGAAYAGEVSGLISDATASVYGVTDISQLSQAALSGNLDKLRLTVMERIAAWEQQKMIELGGATEAGKYISSDQWAAIFAPARQQAEAALALIGTGPTATTIAQLQGIDKARWTAQLPQDVLHAQELAATLSATNSGMTSTLNQELADILATGARATLDATTAGAQVGNATGDRRPLMNAAGTPTPIGGWNAMHAASTSKDLKTQTDKDKYVAEYLAGTDALLRSGGSALPPKANADVVLKGAMSQVVSVFDTVSEKVAAENKAGRVYLPEDSLMENLVSSAASDEFGAQFQALSPRDQNVARTSMKTVLDFETAYIANVLNRDLNAYSTQARADQRTLSGTMDALSSFYGGGLGASKKAASLAEYAGEGELFVMTVDDDTGDVAFSINNYVKSKLSPEQRIEAERQIRNITMDRGRRISNALRAQVQIGNYPTYSEALIAASMVEGWPSHLGLGATAGPSIGLDDVEAQQKKTRGEE